jgi:hypothetical protein
MQTRRFQVIQTLRAMDVIDRPGDLHITNKAQPMICLDRASRPS